MEWLPLILIQGSGDVAGVNYARVFDRAVGKSNAQPCAVHGVRVSGRKIIIDSKDQLETFMRPWRFIVDPTS